jgi:hypothetical protein
METVALHGPRLGIAPMCAAMGLARATYYRHLTPRSPSARPTPARALAPAERQAVLAVLHEPRFVDLAPAEVYATLLDDKRYLCSERTMYRVLAASLVRRWCHRFGGSCVVGAIGLEEATFRSVGAIGLEERAQLGRCRSVGAIGLEERRSVRSVGAIGLEERRSVGAIGLEELGLKWTPKTGPRAKV